MMHLFNTALGSLTKTTGTTIYSHLNHTFSTDSDEFIATFTEFYGGPGGLLSPCGGRLPAG